MSKKKKIFKNKSERMFFGNYGGRYVPEMLVPALEELERTFFDCQKSKTFKAELNTLLKNYCGRPSPLTHAKHLSNILGGAQIYLKNEGLNHTGSHKINNAIGQILLAKHMGKKKIVAETGAGQHGVATATVCAKFGFECNVFMGEIDIKRQYPNLYSMKMLGANVMTVRDGSKTLKDAVNAALKYWIENLNDTHYLLGSAVGPYPYPLIVRHFQSIIGNEVKWQMKQICGKKPSIIIACVGGGSNGMGIFYPFIGDKNVRLYGVEAGGKGRGRGKNAVRFNGEGSVGIAQGYKSYFLQTADGQLAATHSISAGLDYAGVSPELAHLQEIGAVHFAQTTDNEVLKAYQLLAKTEGIFAALESAHAVAYAIKIAPTLNKQEVIVVNISGRGDKDIFITAKHIDKKNWLDFLQQEIAT